MVMVGFAAGATAWLGAGVGCTNAAGLAGFGGVLAVAAPVAVAVAGMAAAGGTTVGALVGGTVAVSAAVGLGGAVGVDGVAHATIAKDTTSPIAHVRITRL